MGEGLLELRFHGGESAPREARRAVHERLHGELDEDTAYDVHVVVSELVSNAVRHGGATGPDAVRVSVCLSPDRVRVEVEDPGPGFDPPERPEPRPTGGGRGLVLLERMTNRWGVSRKGASRVWFEVDRQAA
jgi:anti-sigma regulatory factor (Ser/Thr protein kinase)